MYVRLPMMKEWDDFLVFLGEIRKAFALGKDEIAHARQPLTITEEEFHWLRIAASEDPQEDPGNERWNAISKKFILWDDTPFLHADEEWCLNVARDVTLEYNKERDDLTLEWHEFYWADNVQPLLRLAIILPADLAVQYPHLLISKFDELSEDGKSVDKRITFSYSGLDAEGDFLTFALKTALLYSDAEGKKYNCIVWN